MAKQCPFLIATQPDREDACACREERCAWFHPDIRNCAVSIISFLPVLYMNKLDRDEAAKRAESSEWKALTPKVTL